MRKLVVFTLTTVDGAVDDPRRYFVDNDASVVSAPVIDQVMVDKEAQLIGRQDAVLMGRTTFDEWSRYWPTSDEQPFADFINCVEKYVVTSRPLPDTWPNASAVSGPLDQIVADLKAQPGGDIGVHASITLVQALLARGLVDELQLAVGPVLDPVGRRLFSGLDELRRLSLVEAIPTPGGALWVTYRRAE